MRGVRRVELVVVGSLVLSTPSILQAFDGGIAVSTALLRLAGALVLCWAVGAIVERTLDTYARQARQRELSQRIEQLRASRARLVALPVERPAPGQSASTAPHGSEGLPFQ